MSDDFFDKLKSKEDRIKEWTDAAEFFVDIRRDNRQEEFEPLPETDKTAGVGTFAQRFDPTGIADIVRSGPSGKAGALAGAALFGLGTALTSKGRKELGGKSKIESSLLKDKAERDKLPEPKSFFGKSKNIISDAATGISTAARKHPVGAGMVGAVGGAKLLGGMAKRLKILGEY